MRAKLHIISSQRILCVLYVWGINAKLFRVFGLTFPCPWLRPLPPPLPWPPRSRRNCPPRPSDITLQREHISWDVAVVYALFTLPYLIYLLLLWDSLNAWVLQVLFVRMPSLISKYNSLEIPYHDRRYHARAYAIYEIWGEWKLDLIVQKLANLPDEHFGLPCSRWNQNFA